MSNQRILFVDDEENILNGLRRSLRKHFDVQIAVGPEAGLRVLEENGPFAVVVSDYVMPGMNGVSFLKEAKVIAPNSVRMMLTGYADMNNAIRAINEGSIFRFLTKPCETEVMVKALTDGLEQYRLVMLEKELSLSDPLTGGANRRDLENFIQGAIERNKRYEEVFSVIMTDIDYFKQINDGYGHDVGDEVLRVFSRLLKDKMRIVDLVARFGGEEFFIVMPKAGLEQAMAKAEKLRMAVEQLNVEGMEKGVTSSFGVAEYVPGESDESLFKRVDEAVFASKHAGRNCVSKAE